MIGLHAQHKNAKKLNRHTVEIIRERLAAGEKQESIAYDYGIAQSHVSRIKRWKIWTNAKERTDDA